MIVLTMSQKNSACSRVFERISVTPAQPVYRPATTVASTPDPPSACGSQKARNGVISESMTSMRGSRAQCRSRSTMCPTIHPHTVSPTSTSTKSRAAVTNENCPVMTAMSATLNRMSAVASLTRPSPSSTAVMRRGMPRRSATASGATTSGGDTTAPRMNATPSGRPMSQWPAIATATVVAPTQPIASSRMGRRLARNACQLIVNAAK